MRSSTSRSPGRIAAGIGLSSVVSPIDVAFTRTRVLASSDSMIESCQGIARSSMWAALRAKNRTRPSARWRCRLNTTTRWKPGFQRVVVFNRHLHRAEGLVRFFARSAAHMELRAMPWHDSIIESELAKTRVLVNATSIGLTTDESPIPAAILPGDLLVLDLIYNRTRFLRDAAAAGCTVLDGETMLLHQGAAAFSLWTGQPAPLEVMSTALAEARAQGLRSAEGEFAGEEAATAGDEAATAGRPAGEEAAAPTAG